jgi:phosphopantetheinyl transferase (holo-ACP synthase)
MVKVIVVDLIPTDIIQIEDIHHVIQTTTIMQRLSVINAKASITLHVIAVQLIKNVICVAKRVIWLGIAETDPNVIAVVNLVMW